MAQCATPRLRCQFHRLQTQPPAQPGLGLEAVLPAATIAQVLRDEGGIWRSIVYTPWLTFWAFFWQVLSPDRSCRSALKRLAAWMGLRGQETRRRRHRSVLQGPGAAAGIGARVA